MKSPRIEDYQFGYICIDGQEYNKDLIILPDKIVTNWWRKSGHNLSIDDLKEVFNAAPEILVIGRGSVSRMEVPNDTINALVAAEIEVKSLPTKEACEFYNKLRDQRVVATALHLTC